MGVRTRQTLVLRGVTVVLGGQTPWVRMGREYLPSLGTPAFPISMRHPSPGCMDQAEPGRLYNRANYNGVDVAAPRAGRSDSLAGVLVSRSPDLRGNLVSGKAQGLATGPLVHGGLSLLRATRAQRRLKAGTGGLMRVGPKRFAASTRGKGER
jgi:hypothetical protein